MRSALHPIIHYFEEAGIPVIGQGEAIARDVGMNFITMMYAYTSIASPISREFAALVQDARDKIEGEAMFLATPSPDEQAIILKQPLVPVDKIYASKVTEIHSSPPVESWNFKLGVLRSDRRTIAIQMKLPMDSDKLFIDNIIDMIRPFVGTFGARVVQILYEIANDPPYFRHPVITVDPNEMLDRLGLKRDRNGYHRSKNRERLRDALNAAHYLEIIGEYTTWENGRQIHKQFYRTVLSLIGATFDAEENAGISAADLRTQGLPKSVRIRLNFYDGIRRPNGTLGNQYVLVPRLPASKKLKNANYAKTYELLKAYLLFRYRQTRMASRKLVITRQTALEKTNITNKNSRRATMTLRKALDCLVEDGTLESYSSLLPAKSYESLEVVLSEEIIRDLSLNPDQDSLPS
jgi:hypothetical protein